MSLLLVCGAGAGVCAGAAAGVGVAADACPRRDAQPRTSIAAARKFLIGPPFTWPSVYRGSGARYKIFSKLSRAVERKAEAGRPPRLFGYSDPGHQPSMEGARQECQRRRTGFFATRPARSGGVGI